MIGNHDCQSEDFSEETDLPERLERLRFTDCRFNSLSFAETELVSCVFENCSFDFTKICGKIDKCAFLNCSFNYADLLGAEFAGCKMTGSDLSKLSDAGFSVSGGDFSYTLLSKLILRKNDLSDVNFTGANIFDCRFENCKLSGARFDNAVISGLSLDLFDNLMLTVKNATNKRKSKTKQMASVSITGREYPEAFNVAIHILNENALLSD